MRLKILLVSLILSLPFWWGLNILAENLEDFLFWQKTIENPQILAAKINQKILKRKAERLEFQKFQTESLEDLEIEAKAVISVEVDSRGRERILFEKNSEESLPIASLTKLMTALAIFDLDETYNLFQLVRVSEEAVSQEGCSKYGDLRIGEKLSVEALLYVMLIESSNDAAFALSQLIGQEGFVELMNFYAEDLGLQNTHFVNSTGLESNNILGPKNLSTARDLIKLAKYLLENYPQIFEITTNNSFLISKPDGSLHHFIPENTNKLLNESASWRTEIIGGKTGWSPAAGGCLLLVLKNPNSNSYFINVVLGSNDRFGEMKKLIEAIKEPPNF